MVGELYIDNVDIYTAFGLQPLDGNYCDLVSFPPLKTPKSNDWQEEDGIEVDLAEPHLDKRQVKLKLFSKNGIAGLSNLIDLISNGAYHNYQFNGLAKTYRLRLMTHNAYEEIFGGAAILTLTLAEDSYDYDPNQEPQSSIPLVDDFSLDNRPLTDYGVRVLEGTLASIDKQPDTKQNLLINISTQDGNEYDGYRVRYKSKEVQVNCLMRAENIADFWRNHDSLLSSLLQAGERQLGCKARKTSYYCYYKSCKTNDFTILPNGKVWWEFSLTLVFTQYRLRSTTKAIRTAKGNIIRLTSTDELRVVDTKK